MYFWHSFTLLTLVQFGICRFNGCSGCCRAASPWVGDGLTGRWSCTVCQYVLGAAAPPHQHPHGERSRTQRRCRPINCRHFTASINGPMKIQFADIAPAVATKEWKKLDLWLLEGRPVIPVEKKVSSLSRTNACKNPSLKYVIFK